MRYGQKRAMTGCEASDIAHGLRFRVAYYNNSHFGYIVPILEMVINFSIYRLEHIPLCRRADLLGFTDARQVEGLTHPLFG